MVRFYDMIFYDCGYGTMRQKKSDQFAIPTVVEKDFWSHFQLVSSVDRESVFFNLG